MKPLVALGIPALAAFTLSGCESIGVGLGLRTHLDQVSVIATISSPAAAGDEAVTAGVVCRAAHRAAVD